MSLNIAIVGAGGMASYHVQGFKNAGANVVAVADPNAKAAAACAARLGIGKTYDSLENLIKGEGAGLDAVTIITPNKFHQPLCVAALKAGKHVFCEKPPALNAAEALSMKQAAKESGKTLMFNFNNRARPESYAMMEYLRGGEAGRINSAQAVWVRRAGIPGFGGWFTTKALSGGGPLIDLLHMIDLALYFMGYPDPKYVLAQTFSDFITDKTFKGPWGIPDVAGGVTDVESAGHAFVRFADGQVLSLRTSWAEMVEREEVSVTFQGKKAGGKVQRLFGIDGDDSTSQDKCELYTHENGRPVNRTIKVPADPSMGRIRSAENFVRVLEGKEEPLNTPGQAVALMKIIDAVYQSASTGKPVEVV